MTPKTKTAKPEKPYPEFPLFPHATRRWAKKIKGKMFYFGPWNNPDAALAKYLRERDYRFAGQEPPSEGETRLMMADLCDQFCKSKEKLVESGDISKGMWFDYFRICRRLLEITGKGSIVESLKPTDFDVIRSKLATGVSKVTQANRIRLARIVFKFAYDQDLVEKPIKFGQNFSIPKKAAIRAERQSRPSKEFTAEEIRSLIDASGATLRAMILLGINCGFGNNDCATLPMSAIDEAGWIDFPRPKTSVERRCPLWPETIKALMAARAERSEPEDDENRGLMFITKHGRPYVTLSKKGSHRDAIAWAFADLLSSVGLDGNRRGFYSLRRTFETVAGDSRDQIATDHVMGHSPAADDMSAIYRQHITDDRLIDVSNYVRAWLWPKPTKKRRR